MSRRFHRKLSRLVLIRHGETDWNADGRLQGHEDIPLNGVGQSQADALAARLVGDAVHAVYSSDLARAFETARCIGVRAGRPVVTDVRLRERHLGVVQGMSKATAELAMAEVYAGYKSEDPDYAIPGGETAREFAARVLACIHELAHRHAGESTVVVAHGGVLDQVYRHAAGLPVCGPRAFTLLNASVNHLTFEDGVWRIGAWGDVSHLEQSLSLDEN